jgi:hypothetical protein
MKQPFPKLYKTNRTLFTSKYRIQKFPFGVDGFVSFIDATRSVISNEVQSWLTYVNQLRDITKYEEDQLDKIRGNRKKEKELNEELEILYDKVQRNQRLEDEARLLSLYSLFTLSGEDIYEFNFETFGVEATINEAIKNTDFSLKNKTIHNDTFFIQFLNSKNNKNPFIKLSSDFDRRFGITLKDVDKSQLEGWYVTTANNRFYCSIDITPVFKNPKEFDSSELDSDYNYLLEEFSLYLNKANGSVTLVFSEMNDPKRQICEIRIHDLLEEIINGNISDTEYCQYTLISNSLLAILPILTQRYNSYPFSQSVPQIFNRLSSSEKSEFITLAVEEMMTWMTKDKYEIIYNMDSIDQGSLLSILTANENESILMVNDKGQQLFQSHNFTFKEENEAYDAGKALIRFTTKKEPSAHSNERE